MKKIYLLILPLLFFNTVYSYADCETGYACSISELEAREASEERQEKSVKKNYDFQAKSNNDTDADLIYEDLFPFSNFLKDKDLSLYL